MINEIFKSLYLLPMAVAFCFCIVFALLLMIFFRKKTKENRLSDRHVHKKGISRLGGIAIIVSFLVSLLLDKHLVMTTALFGVYASSLLILLFGLWDDISQLHWKIQLFFQVAIVAIVTLMGVKIEYLRNPFGGIFFFPAQINHIIFFLIAVAWVVFLMNAMNWADGIDGLSGGISLIATAAILILSLRPEVNQPPVGIIAAALFGSLAAFLLLNFYPAKIMAGTSGSMFMGFILAILAIFAGAKMATTLLVLVVPVLDALWVILERYKMNKSIFLADKSHLHYRLMALGWSQKKVSLFYYAITIIVAMIALNTKMVGKIFTFALFVLLSVLSVIIVRKKTQVKMG